MKRRTFIQTAAGLSAASYVVPHLIISKNRDVMHRIGLSSVMFRMRILQDGLDSGFTLLDVPEFFADRFNVHWIDFDSRHLGSQSSDYLVNLKNKLDAAKSTLANIQVNARYDLSSTDEAQREQSVQFIKGWIDTAATLGSKALRANPGKRGTVEKSIESLKELNQYGIKKGVQLLTENHGGIEANPDVHVRLVKAVDSDNFGTLPDYGNYPNDESRYERLKKIMPYAKLISAKVGLFNEKFEHISFDFDRCVRITEESGFTGVYACEQWIRNTPSDMDFEKVSDWMIERLKTLIAP